MDQATIGRPFGDFCKCSIRFPEETIWMICVHFWGEGPERNPTPRKDGMEDF